MDVLVKYPTRARPALFCKVLTRYMMDPSVRFLVSIDHDDTSMNNGRMNDWISARPGVRLRVSHSHNKIQAINDGVQEEPWDLMIVASDDMIPQVRDYAQRIVQLFTIAFPKGDGVLHLNDGRAGSKLNTLPIMDRKYFNRFGYVYHPAYESLWADNEFQEVSEQLGRSAWVDQVLIKHEWVDLTGKDALHYRNEKPYERDRKTFESRKSKGFPIANVAMSSSPPER